MQEIATYVENIYIIIIKEILNFKKMNHFVIYNKIRRKFISIV